MEWSGLIGGALGAAASIYNNERNNKYAREAAEKQNELNRQAADLAWQRELSVYEDQKIYNSPAAQMQRFKDAGLNANLIYGQGNNGNMSSIPKYDTPHMVAAQQQAADLTQAMNLANAFQSYQNQKSQGDYIREKANQEAIKNLSLQGRLTEQLRGMQLGNQQKSVRLQYLDDLMNASLDKLRNDAAYSQNKANAQAYTNSNILPHQANAAKYQAGVSRKTYEWYEITNIAKLIGGLKTMLLPFTPGFGVKLGL